MALHLTAAMSRLTIASPSRHTPKQVVSTRTLGGFCNTMRGQSLVGACYIACAAACLTAWRWLESPASSTHPRKSNTIYISSHSVCKAHGGDGSQATDR